MPGRLIGKGFQTLPPTARIGNVRLQAGHHQRALGAGERHVKPVQLFAATGGLFNGQYIGHAGRWFGFAGQVDKTPGVGGLARPVHQYAHGLRFLCFAIGVQQQNKWRLQPFGAMHSQEPHSLGISPHRRGVAAGTQGAHQRIGSDVPPTIHLQRCREQSTQIRQHGVTLVGGCGDGKTGQHIAMVVDGAERVIRRQSVDPSLPQRQRGADGSQRGRQISCSLQHLEPRHFANGHGGFLHSQMGRSQHGALTQNQLHQVVVRHTEQWRLQGSGQGQIMRRRHQGVQQGYQVLHLGHLRQFVLLRLLGGDAQFGQFGLHQAQALALAGQHHDVLGPQCSGL